MPFKPLAQSADSLLDSYLAQRSVSQVDIPGRQMGKKQDPSETGGRKTGLPDGLKAGIETLSGLGMDDVKVHYNSYEPGKVQALAYAQGSEIYLAPGHEEHLPHEAWHVAQQKQGRVQPTAQIGEVAINDDQALEREADRMGARAAQLQGPLGASEHGPSTHAAIQRVINPDTGKEYTNSEIESKWKKVVYSHAFKGLNFDKDPVEQTLYNYAFSVQLDDGTEIGRLHLHFSADPGSSDASITGEKLKSSDRGKTLSYSVPKGMRDGARLLIPSGAKG